MKSWKTIAAIALLSSLGLYGCTDEGEYGAQPEQEGMGEDQGTFQQQPDQGQQDQMQDGAQQ